MSLGQSAIIKLINIPKGRPPEKEPLEDLGESMGGGVDRGEGMRRTGTRDSEDLLSKHLNITRRSVGASRKPFQALALVIILTLDMSSS